MKTAGYYLLGVVAVLWLLAIVIGAIAAFPVGIIGLIALAGFGLLMMHVIKERLANEEDDYYDKNIDL